jgi:hypothetical protein
MAANPLEWGEMSRVALLSIPAKSVFVLVPGYFYVKGTLDQTKVLDQYHRAEASCAGPVRTP